MRNFLLIPILALPILALIYSVPAQAENLTGNAVVLRALDKVTASTQDFTVSIGERLQYGSLKVDVKHCEKRPPEDIPETYAFLQIFDAPAPKKTKKNKGNPAPVEDIKVFSGWMLSSSPAASALDHRVYDIWVLDCVVPEPDPESGPEFVDALELRPC